MGTGVTLKVKEIKTTLYKSHWNGFHLQIWSPDHLSQLEAKMGETEENSHAITGYNESTKMLVFLFHLIGAWPCIQ